jgi:hypothetical protein
MQNFASVIGILHKIPTPALFPHPGPDSGDAFLIIKLHIGSAKPNPDLTGMARRLAINVKILRHPFTDPRRPFLRGTGAEDHFLPGKYDIQQISLSTFHIITSHILWIPILYYTLQNLSSTLS